MKKRLFAAVLCAAMAMTSCAGKGDKDNSDNEKPELDPMNFTINGEEITVPCKLGDIKGLIPGEKEEARDGYYRIELKSDDELLATAFCYTPDENDNDMSDDEVTDIMVSCFKLELLKDEGKDVSFSYLGGGADTKIADIKEKLGEPVKEEDMFLSLQGLDNMMQFDVEEGAVVAACIDGETISTLGIYSKDSFSMKNAEKRKQLEKTTGEKAE